MTGDRRRENESVTEKLLIGLSALNLWSVPEKMFLFLFLLLFLFLFLLLFLFLFLFLLLFLLLFLFLFLFLFLWWSRWLFFRSRFPPTSVL